MQLSTFLTGLQKYPYLCFDQIIIDRNEKESSFSAKSLQKPLYFYLFCSRAKYRLTSVSILGRLEFLVVKLMIFLTSLDFALNDHASYLLKFLT